MRTVTYIVTFLGGAIVCFLLFSLGVVDRIDGIRGATAEPMLSLPTYLSFLGVMLTAVTVVLAALAIGIGVVAAYTFREIKLEAGKVTAATIEIALSDDAINARIDRVVFAHRPNPTVAELEENFDSSDDGNR